MPKGYEAVEVFVTSVSGALTAYPVSDLKVAIALFMGASIPVGLLMVPLPVYFHAEVAH